MSRPGNVMMIVGYGNFTHGADDRGDMLLVVRAKRHERDQQLDEVICEPLLGRASVQAMSFPILHGCHGPIVSNAPIPVIRRRSADRPNRQPMVTRVHRGMIRPEPTRSPNECDA
jgi:hypothetical protein